MTTRYRLAKIDCMDQIDHIDGDFHSISEAVTASHALVDETENLVYIEILEVVGVTTRAPQGGASFHTPAEKSHL